MRLAAAQQVAKTAVDGLCTAYMNKLVIDAMGGLETAKIIFHHSYQQEIALTKEEHRYLIGDESENLKAIDDYLEICSKYPLTVQEK